MSKFWEKMKTLEKTSDVKVSSGGTLLEDVLQMCLVGGFKIFASLLQRSNYHSYNRLKPCNVAVKLPSNSNVLFEHQSRFLFMLGVVDSTICLSFTSKS